MKLTGILKPDTAGTGRLRAAVLGDVMRTAWPVLIVTAWLTVQAADIPVIGCASDGQLGPQPAPEKRKISLPIDESLSSRVAYYETASGAGVLGPNGWNCFGTYGSNGSSVYVARGFLKSEDRIGPPSGLLRGPAVQLSHIYGGTSGRFAVAGTIFRVFPEFHAAGRALLGHDELRSGFPTGPFAGDTVTHRDKHIAVYRTPPRRKGLGTQSSLAANGAPIAGAVLLTGDTPDLLYLAVRLPAGMEVIARVILDQAIARAEPLALRGSDRYNRKR